MSTNRVFHTVLVAIGVLLMSACASQPAATTQSLDEKYFKREANNYLKFQHEGQTVYCQNDPNAGSLIPHKWCITEAALRQRVESSRLSRNPVSRGGPPYVATVPGGSGT
jgi:outer membrane biogenesis lipoprotein LolB